MIDLTASSHAPTRLRATDRRFHDRRESGSAWPTAPPRYRRFVPHHALGCGGQGSVTAALDRHRGVLVALKTASGSDAEAEERIKAEFRLLRRLAHPAVVRPLGLHRSPDGVFLTEELVEGKPIDRSLRIDAAIGQLPDLTRFYALVGQLAAALDHCHQRGIVHGDIKPQNALVTADDRIRLIDFGLARSLLAQPWEMPAPRLAGTFAYLAPEVVALGRATPASDLYTLGRLMTYLLAGRLPCWDPQEGSAQVEQRIVAQLPRETPSGLVRLCIDLLRSTPQQRPTAAQVAQQLSSDRWPRRPAARGDRAGADHGPSIGQTLQSALERAERGEGSLVLLEAESLGRQGFAQRIGQLRSQQPLVRFCGRCDPRERIPLRAFDAVLTALGRWAERLPESVRQRWLRPGEGIESISPVLHAALAGAEPRRRARLGGKAAGLTCATRVLTRIARQRILVLGIEHLDRADRSSLQLIRRLVRAMPHAPIVLIGTLQRTERTPVLLVPDAANTLAMLSTTAP